jgi:hypothetical protein
VSGKPSEEGWFWEWRAFGVVPEPVAARVRAHETRGEPDVEGDDLYLVSSLTDQNVKLRADGGLLKLKPRLAALADGCELFEETARLIWTTPVPAAAVAKAAALLGVAVDAGEPLDAERLRRAFEAAPEVRLVRARKRRTQYAIGEAWVELADVVFPRGAVRTIGVQSPRLDETRRVRDLVDPDGLLSPLGYVDACRRWG